VRRGDSPYVIAERHQVSLDALLAANGLNRRSSIYPGDELLIPGGDAERLALSYRVRRGDTLGAIADAHGISLGSLLAANGLSSRSVIHPGDSLTIPRQ
jgi:LysM repeat protein